MTTATVPSVFINSSTIQQEVYQAVYDIWALPDDSDNHHLAASLTLPGEDHVQVVKFGTNQIKGSHILNVAVTLLRNVGKEGKWRLHWKQEWEFEGVLWHCQLHAKKDGTKTIDAKVWGTWNSRDGQGKLYVLAHEQPKPLVEVLSWEKMYDTINHHGSIVERKERGNGAPALLRGRLTDVERDNQYIVTFVCDNVYRPQDRKWADGAQYIEWMSTGNSGFIIPIRNDDPLPIALADGRFLFATGNCDFTIYPPGFDVDCP